MNWSDRFDLVIAFVCGATLVIFLLYYIVYIVPYTPLDF